MFRIAICAVLVLINLAAVAASPIEGEWQVTNRGARLCFRASAGAPGSYDIVWMDGPDFSITPGTVIGYANETPETGVFDCRVSTDPRGKGDKKRYARFVIRLDADTGDTFKFAPYEQGVKISLYSLLPYWWRRPVKTVNNRPSGLDGARRVGAPNPYVEL